LYRNNIKDTDCRFDVIAIYHDSRGSRKTDHYLNAFEID
jgi:Holliday junction resolvase-like predicted endonuclease